MLYKLHGMSSNRAFACKQLVVTSSVKAGAVMLAASILLLFCFVGFQKNGHHAPEKM